MISICVITRNEEKNIRRCLESLKPLGYEIVVVDTGSQDLTKEAALEYTEHVYDFEWCDDFSAARNFALGKAQCEWILMVDSDEFLISYDQVQLESLVKAYPERVGRIRRINCFMQKNTEFKSQEPVNRLFPKKSFCYEGRVHEQIVSKNNQKYETYDIPLSFEHAGYIGNEQERRRKATRNIELLQKMLLEKEDPYILYQIGKSYYYMGEYLLAKTQFEQAMKYDLNPKQEYVSDMVEMYGYSMINSGEYKEAMGLQGIYDAFSYRADFVFLMGYIYMQNEQFDMAVEQFQKAAAFQSCSVLGVNSYLAYYNIGVIYECTNRKQEALKYYKKCGEYEPALEGKKRLANELS